MGQLDNEKLLHVKTVEPSTAALPADRPDHVRSLEQYKKLYQRSVDDPAGFFGDIAKEQLDWIRPFDKALYSGSEGTLADSPTWFVNGWLNACYNCVDRHALKDATKPAIIYEGDEPDQGFTLTYGQLLERICKLSQLLLDLGVKSGDVVTIYLPMIPEAIIAIMAVLRIGAVHSCVFAGFSPGALRDRILDAKSKVIISTDFGFRATKVVKTKEIVDAALKDCPDVSSVVVIQRSPGKCAWVEGRDVDYQTGTSKYKPYFPPTPVDSEHPLFLLYTSGSTGKPKGVQHSTAGYLLGALLTTKHIFGVSPEDIMFTSGDIGWITGHTYAVYGPLLNGATTIIFESTPVYPTPTRYWDIIDKYNVTQFYTAPTALRLLRKYGEDIIKPYKFSSLRVLGSVGEPIAEEVWQWYYDNIGRGKCTLCDTYWLTESGSILASSFPGVTPMKPGAAGFPFFGIKMEIMDPVTGALQTQRPAEGVLAISQPWPSMARTIAGDYGRFQDTYLKPYPGHFFPGDGGAIDKDGFIFVSGRMDDVVNVSGHRLSTAEVEACFLEGNLDGRPIVVEAAVVGIDDEITGQAIMAFVVLEPWLKQSIEAGERKDTEASTLAVQLVRKEIGPFASPRKVFVVDDLPKTRSGKIMRRVLRKIVQGQQDQLGELSTLSNPGVIQNLISATASK